MPGTGAGASYGDLLITSLVVLGVVCVAAFVAVRVFGRLLAGGRSRGAHLMDVVARVALEPRRSLYVVEVAGKTLLVGTSEMGLNVLSELDGEAVRSRVVERPGFGEMVRAALARRRGVKRADGDGAGARDGETAREQLDGVTEREQADGVTVREPADGVTARELADGVTERDAGGGGAADA